MAGASPRRAGMLVLCYLSLLAVVPLLAEKEDREVQWHARNGLALFAAVIAIGIGATLVGLLFPSLGCLYGVSMLFALVAYVSIVLLAVVKAIQGERLVVPWISRHAG